MKKFVLILSVFVMIMSFSSCGSKQEIKDSKDDQDVLVNNESKIEESIAPSENVEQDIAKQVTQPLVTPNGIWKCKNSIRKILEEEENCPEEEIFVDIYFVFNNKDKTITIYSDETSILTEDIKNILMEHAYTQLEEIHPNFNRDEIDSYLLFYGGGEVEDFINLCLNNAVLKVHGSDFEGTYEIEGDKLFLIKKEHKINKEEYYTLELQGENIIINNPNNIFHPYLIFPLVLEKSTGIN